MNKEEKLDYIFGSHPTEPIQNRFEWLNSASLGDIQTFIDGVDTFLNAANESSLKHPHGGGNLSIPILVCTGLELVSALYTGKTRYALGQNYNATENVEKFVISFFPNHARQIPRLLWDGVRNGIDHVFVPKSMQFSQIAVKFIFYVQDRSVKSYVTKCPEMILIRINSVQFYEIFKKAIDDYKTELKNNEELQYNFIYALKSIENHVQDITTNHKVSSEVEYLLNELKQSGTLSLFD